MHGLRNRTVFRQRGFTLVELLVVVSIIALLVAILLPSLRKARAQAKRSVCLSNLKELGIGASMYAHDYDDYIPPLKSWIDSGRPDVGPQPYPPGGGYNGYYGALGEDDQRIYYPTYAAVLGLFECPGAKNTVKSVNDIRDSYDPSSIERRGNAYEYIPFLYNVVYRPKEVLKYQVSTFDPGVMPLRLHMVKRPAEVSVLHDADEPGNNWFIDDPEDPHPILKGGNMMFADSHAEFIKAGPQNKNWIEWSDKGRPRVRR